VLIVINLDPWAKCLPLSVDAAQTIPNLLPALVAHARGTPEHVVWIDGALDVGSIGLLVS
jgi:hypothetical protein